MKKLFSEMKVLVAEPIDNLEYTLNPIKDLGVELIVGPPVSKPDLRYSELELIEICKDIDAFVGMAREKVTANIIDNANKLKIICKYGNGVDNIDVNAATQKGVLVANAPVHDMTVAEFAFTLILGVLKKLPRNVKHLHNGLWRDESTMGNELYKKNVGILGFGAIGRQLAQRLMGWETKILVHDPFIDKTFLEKYSASMVSFETLFAESDIVSVHIPLTTSTRGIVGKDEFSLMKKNAIIINTSRGPVIDELALIEALATGKIAGAGMDVFEKEPIKQDNPLLKMENVVLTPHIAGYTQESLTRIAEQTTRNCMQGLIGEIPDFIVNKDALPLWREKFFK